MQGQSKAAGYYALMAAVIDRAVLDLKGSGPPCRAVETDRAMAFILGDDCEVWCLELGIDYKTLRERAAALYRRTIEREEPENGGKKRPGKPTTGHRRQDIQKTLILQ